MKHDPHTEQIIQTAHRIIGHMNSLIRYFNENDDHWKICANLLRYDAENLQQHFEQHIALARTIKEESE